MPLLLSLCVAVVEAILLGIASQIFHFNAKSALTDEFTLQLVILLPYVALAAPIWWWHRQKRLVLAARFVPAAPLTLGIACMAGIGLGLAQLNIRRILSPYFNPGYDGNPWHFAVILLVAAALAPCVEELFFRGAVMGWLLPRLGKAGAVIASAVLFSLLHPTSITLMAGALLLGLASGYLVLRTRSFWPSIVLHCSVNAAVTTSLFLSVAAFSHTYTDGFVALRAGAYPRAFAIWHALAEKGDARAEGGVGALYVAGRGTLRDVPEGIRWLSLASAHGDAEGAYNLAQGYTHDSGLPKDFPKAAALYAIGAAKGLARAQAQLGLLYAAGKGVPQDMKRAYMWTALAAAGRYKSAGGTLSDLRSRMSEAQIREADATVTRCRASGFKDCN